MDVLKRIPVREQDAKERATNFKEVCLGYNKEEAMEEASRCINCKNAQCVKGCPVAIQIPQFIEQVKNGNIEEAYWMMAGRRFAYSPRLLRSFSKAPASGRRLAGR